MEIGSATMKTSIMRSTGWDFLHWNERAIKTEYSFEEDENTHEQTIFAADL